MGVIGDFRGLKGRLPTRMGRPDFVCAFRKRLLASEF
jgi:hypothetical protein